MAAVDMPHAVFERLDAPPPIFGSPHYLEECTIWQIPGSAWSIQVELLHKNSHDDPVLSMMMLFFSRI